MPLDLANNGQAVDHMAAVVRGHRSGFHHLLELILQQRLRLAAIGAVPRSLFRLPAGMGFLDFHAVVILFAAVVHNVHPFRQIR